MRICIPTTDETGYESEAHDHLGSAPFFAVIDTDSSELKVVKNPDCHDRPGSCHHIPIFQAQKIDAVACEAVGHRSFAALEEAGIAVFAPVSGTVRKIVNAIGAGEVSRLSADQARRGGLDGHRRDEGGRHGHRREPRSGGHDHRHGAGDPRHDSRRDTGSGRQEIRNGAGGRRQGHRQGQGAGKGAHGRGQAAGRGRRHEGSSSEPSSESEPGGKRRERPPGRRDQIEQLAGRKIGLFGRGGSGKSTVTALLAKALRLKDYEVVVLDADSTNMGLPGALGLEPPSRQLIEHFGGMVFRGGSVTCPVDDPTPLANPDIFVCEGPEGVVARGVDGISFLTVGKMGREGAGAGCDGPISKIARDLKIHGEGADPVTLVDFKAGIEDTARGVVTGLDWAVVVVNPTLAAVEMAADMKKTIEDVRGGAPPATRHLDDPALVELARHLYAVAPIRGIQCVLNNVPDRRTERFLRRKLAEQGLETAGIIHADASIAHAWLEGKPLDARKAVREAEEVIDVLEIADAAGIIETAGDA